jgi:protein-S-isoprenylcysteine O-methyltransferase Ste14
MSLEQNRNYGIGMSDASQPRLRMRGINRCFRRGMDSFRRFALRGMDSFRHFALFEKLYTISYLILGASILIALLADFPKSRQAILDDTATALMQLGFALASVGLAILICRRIRRLWDTTIGKFLLASFLAPGSFLADLYIRQEIYKFTSENPEVFTSPRAALTWLAALFFSLFIAALVAAVATTVPAVVLIARAGMCLLKRRPRPPIMNQFGHVLGFLGLFAFLGLSYATLEAKIPRVERYLKTVAVYTGFYHVPDHMYAALKPNSFVAFLPGDRVCVAELSPDGKFNFHTIRRDDLK